MEALIDEFDLQRKVTVTRAIRAGVESGPLVRPLDSTSFTEIRPPRSPRPPRSSFDRFLNHAGRARNLECSYPRVAARLERARLAEQRGRAKKEAKEEEQEARAFPVSSS